MRTLASYEPQDISKIYAFFDKKCKYLCYGKEIGKNGTPHLQGYFRLHTRVGLKNIKKDFSRGHLEGARGSFQANIDYCSKDGEFTEFGERPQQGKRSDIQTFYKMINNGASFDEVIAATDGNAWLYEAKIQKMISHKKRYERIEQIKKFGIHSLLPKDVRFYWGNTGTGKTSTAMNEFPDAHIQYGCRWFDGYAGQDCVIFDEYVTQAFPASIFLRLTDKYPMSVEFKGGMSDWMPKTIIFTTNLNPDDFFADWIPSHKDAAFRRVTEIREFTKDPDATNAEN